MSWQRSPGSDTGVGGPIGGTVTRKVLDRAFGPRLLNDIEYPDDSRLSSASAASQGEEKRGHEVDISSSGTSRSVGPLAGTETVAGRLQASWAELYCCRIGKDRIG